MAKQILHPVRHEWIVQGDVVTMREHLEGEDWITEIERHERCDYCPRERISVIEVWSWQVLRRRYRGENVPPEERSMPRSELASEVEATTPNAELKAQIKRMRKKGKV